MHGFHNSLAHLLNPYLVQVPFESFIQVTSGKSKVMVMWSCICTSIHSDLLGPELQCLCMNFKIIGRNFSPERVRLPPESFIDIGQRSRSHRLDKLSLDNLLVFIL